MTRSPIRRPGFQPEFGCDGERLIEVELASLGQADYSCHC
jgi:hypothetical protein